MSEPVVRVENLSKKYYIGSGVSGSLRETLVNFWRRLFDKKGSEKEIFWALKDISFEIEEGEVLGIIGKNGAGKSTILKILSRITEPTSGKIEINGRVSSLLEVGTGFHPELTGRENIFLNGTILGMTRKEVKTKFDEIVDFSGIEKFIDTPVKHYSSGMYVRLAFAVAAHLEPEILIIDEVLAVGDSEFQKKCLGKMKDVAGQGRTVIFVSHNIQAISALTTNCLYLINGQVHFFGNTNDAISKYLYSKKEDYILEELELNTPRITSVKINTSEKNNKQVQGARFSVKFTLFTPRELSGAAISFQVIDSFGIPILHILNKDSEVPFCRHEGRHEIICEIPKLRLYPGKYSLNVYFAEQSTKEHFDTLEGICPFEVVILNEIREYYWFPNFARYIEDYTWIVR